MSNDNDNDSDDAPPHPQRSSKGNVFRNRKPPMPLLDIQLALTPRPDNQADVLAKKDAIEKIGAGIDAKDAEVVAYLGDDLRPHQIDSFHEHLDELFAEVPTDYFGEQQFYFDQPIRMDEAAMLQFVRTFEDVAEKNGLEVVEVEGSDGLLGEEGFDRASCDAALPPPDPADGVTYYFKSPKGFVSYLQIAPSKTKGRYECVGAVQYGVLPSHPLNQMTDEEVEEIIETRFKVLAAEVNANHLAKSMTSAAKSISEDLKVGKIQRKDIPSNELAVRLNARITDQQEFVYQYLADERARIQHEVKAKLGSGDFHVDGISMYEIDESLHLMQKIHAATKETLIGLNIFEVPRDKTPRRPGDGGPDNQDFQLR